MLVLNSNSGLSGIRQLNVAPVEGLKLQCRVLILDSNSMLSSIRQLHIAPSNKLKL